MIDFQKIINSPAQKQLWKGSKEGDCRQIRLAILNGADIGERDDLGRTALNIASQYGHAEAVKTLTAAKHMLYFAKEVGSKEHSMVLRLQEARKTV